MKPMTNKTPSNKIIKFAVNEEDTEFVESIRVFNVKIPLSSILNEKTVKKELKKALKDQKEEFKKMVEGIEEFEETYCEEDEHLFRAVKNMILKAIKQL